MINLSPEVIQQAADAGSKKIAAAFSRLSGSPVDVTVSRAVPVPLAESLKKLGEPHEHSIVVYAQLLEGIPGASVLLLSRDNALVLVDLLNQKEPGTTAVMKDIDRSAIKETLNILSNSYMNSLSESANLNIGLDVPNMLSPARFSTIIEELVEKDAGENDTAVLFETVLTITEHRIDAVFSLLFNERLAALIQES